MAKIKISCLTPTFREPEAIELVDRALRNQDITEGVEWLIGSPKKIETKYPSIWVEDNFTGGFLNVCRIYNKMLKQASGDLIISWQDYTFSKYDTLSRFWFHYQNEPNTIVTAVGNKYTTVLPELGAMVWKDPRIRDDLGTFYKCYPQDIEGNLASVSKKAFFDVGGFIEFFDTRGYGMDFYNIMKRIFELGKGWDFKIDQSIKSYSLVHDRRKDWEEHNLINEGRYEKIKQELIEKDKWPVVSYLTSGHL